MSETGQENNLDQPGLATPGAAECADLIVHLARLAQGGPGAAELSAAQWTALRYFSRANRFSRTPSAFSQYHATTRGTASQTVKSLVGMGLLQRKCNEMDGRSALIELTPAGRETLQRDPLADLHKVLDALPPASRSALAEALRTATGALAQLRLSPTFGRCEDCTHCDPSPGGAFCHCTQATLMAEEMDALCVDFTPIRQAAERTAR